MTNSKKIVVVAAAALILGVAAGALLTCYGCCKDKVAVVDVQKVVASSKAVAEFKKEQRDSIADLQEWVKKTQEEVEKLDTEKKKQDLALKYREEFMLKQENLRQNEIDRLQEIDADITKLIIKVSKDQGYAQTFAKGNIIYGGTDITEKVIEALD